MAKKHNTYGGGANTNTNGLSFEERTSLDKLLSDNGYVVHPDYTVSFNDNAVGYSIKKAKLSTIFLRSKGINYSSVNSKRWDPDEAFINLSNSTVYIIEKKFQGGNGSVDEKLATFQFKKYEYQKLFSPLGLKVEYLYLLSRNWFSQSKYKDYFDYMDANGCKHFFEDEFTLNDIGLRTFPVTEGNE